MRINGTFLSSAVGRRIFTLFLLASTIPIALLSLVTYRGISDLLNRQARAELSAYSKTYGMEVVTRLNAAQATLERLVIEGPRRPVKVNPLTATDGSMFRSLTVVGGDGSPMPPGAGGGVPAQVLAELAAKAAREAPLPGDEAIIVVPGGAAADTVLALVRHLHPGGAGEQQVVGVLEPSYVFGNGDGLAAQIDVCVFADSGPIPLYCSNWRLLALAQRAAIQPPVRDGTAETMDLGHWTLRSTTRLKFAPWTFTSLRAVENGALADRGIGATYIKVALACVVLVGLLSLVQIRRILVPLERLMDATRRLAAWDFTHPIPIDGRDEFSRLAASFNDMASRLGRQLDTLKVLSRIDRAILSQLDIDPLFGLVLERIGELTPAGLVEVAVLEPAAQGEARMYTLAAGRQGTAEMSRIGVAPQLVQKIAEHPDGLWLDAVEATPLHPQQAGLPRPRFFVLPIVERAKLCAFVCLGLAEGVGLADEVLVPLRDLCDRIGVALSAAARDERLIYQARHDDLTGLPNRLLFKERLSQEIANTQREGRTLALLYIDLDRFKSVNDSLGHTAGDELLGHTAERMRACIRAGDTLARLGGDEFAIILPHISGVPAVTTVAEHVVRSLSEAFVVGSLESYVSASVGIAICPNDASDSEDLLKKADTAMYRAKDSGRNRYVFFEGRMNAAAISRLALERELRQGVARNELALHYQPQIDLRTGRISGAEALLRWNHPVRGVVMPGEFIGVAEETGLIEEIGRRVLLDACARHAAWRSAGVTLPRIAVNVSGRQFRRGDLVQTVEEALRITATPASALEIEVTESVFMDESADAAQALVRLRQMGVQVAIDDFGTGYSSMSYLRRLPVDVLKVDQSFIADMTDDHSSRAIAKAIINLAHTLNKLVVAEGVETAEQVALLKRWRCNRVQGYYYSRPLPPDAFVELLQQREAAVALQR